MLFLVNLEGKLFQTGLPKFYKKQNPRPSTQRTFLSNLFMAGK
jgi:hypothetical protein